MPHIKLLTGRLIGAAWQEPGAILEVPPRVAEMHVKAGTAVVVAAPPPVEQATATPHGEQAVAPRQRDRGNR